MDGERDPLLLCLEKLSPAEEAEMRRRVILDLRVRVEAANLAERMKAIKARTEALAEAKPI